MGTSLRKIPVIFRDPTAKGLFVPVPNYRPGGVPIQISLLARELAKDENFDVYLWVDGEVPAERIDSVELISLRPIIQKGIPYISRYMNQPRKEEIARMLSGGIFIFSSEDQITFPEQVSIIQKNGGKVIYVVASDIELNPEGRGSDGNDAFTRAMLSSDVIFSQTESQQKQLLDRFGMHSRVIPSAAQDIPYSPRKKDQILWVGQAWFAKRPWIVLELARRFPNEHFVMVMPIFDKLFARALIEDAQHLPNLELIHYVEPSKIQEYFNRAKLVINTSLFEGYPNTLHQSSMARAPFISLVWNPDDYLNEREMGAGAGGDVSEMIRIMEHYLGDESLRMKAGESAYQNFAKNHEISIVIERYKEQFRKLAAVRCDCE